MLAFDGCDGKRECVYELKKREGVDGWIQM
jgi:hypothetical protein